MRARLLRTTDGADLTPLTSFAQIPGHVAQRLAQQERVLLILLDAFGLEFLERHRDHPLVGRMHVTPIRSQFPSTTTAHMTTLYFGQPVEQHGLYEWNVLEPSLNEIICPLRYTLAQSKIEGELAVRLPTETLAPGPSFYEQLKDAHSRVYLPEPIAGSTYTRMATRGAETYGFEDLTQATTAALDAMQTTDTTHALIYWDAIDATGHVHGPSSPEFAAGARHALDALHRALPQKPDGVTVLLSADHGQVDVHPTRVDHLDELWPELPDHLAHARPAGSSRDVFLHVKPGHADTVIEALSQRLGDRAQVVPAHELFTTAPMGARLSERLGDVAVLPAHGRQAWLASARANERWFRGQHGGLHPSETATYLAVLQS